MSCWTDTASCGSEKVNLRRFVRRRWLLRGKANSGVEAVVKRSLLPGGMPVERAGIEEIIVAIAKEGRA